MKAVGIDIGSRTIEVTIMRDGNFDLIKEETSIDISSQINRLLNQYSNYQIMATGYGRNLAQTLFSCQTITEISAYAKAAAHFVPDADAVLDIGGQDTKVISLFPNGNIKKFEMNDKCAAGTGKFVEIMAQRLSTPISEFSDLAFRASGTLTINNTCTVFAESEVVSLISNGTPTSEIAYAVCKLVAQKAIAMINRIAPEAKKIVFAGGVSQNKMVKELIEKELNKQLYVPNNAQYFGALGAAIAINKEPK